MSYIGKAPGVGVRNRYYFTATGGETSLSGTDDASNTLAFSDGKYVDVTLNGVTLVAGTDYDTATANTIDNLTALTAGDVVEVVVYDVFSIAAAVPPTGGTFTGLVQFDDQIIIPRGTTAQRPASPVAGSIRFNSTEQRYEGYDGAEWQFLSDGPTPQELEYIVIAGGGGGGSVFGGGGAGGYRSSVSGESSGGGALPESAFAFALSTPYSLTVGAGAPSTGVALGTNGSNGSDSTFASVTSIGGGGGGAGSGQGGLSGGSGGGGSDWAAGGNPGGSGTANQGFAGGAGAGIDAGGGGGGGAGVAGATGATNGGNGGNGVASSITGVSITRAGGGGGGAYTGIYNTNTGGLGGLGGGGDAGQTGGAYRASVSGNPGTANTGGGGGGGTRYNTNVAGGAGGSGVILLKVPTKFSATFSAGVSQTSATVGTDTVYTITAAGASDTVTFS